MIRRVLEKLHAPADTLTSHAHFHLATVICRRFPAGAERDAWLAWLDAVAATPAIGRRCDVLPPRFGNQQLICAARNPSGRRLS
jgi:hypothetical protein